MKSVVYFNIDKGIFLGNFRWGWEVFDGYWCIINYLEIYWVRLLFSGWGV